MEIVKGQLSPYPEVNFWPLRTWNLILNTLMCAKFRSINYHRIGVIDVSFGLFYSMYFTHRF
jgi:hypothetical protein